MSCVHNQSYYQEIKCNPLYYVGHSVLICLGCKNVVLEASYGANSQPCILIEQRFHLNECMFQFTIWNKSSFLWKTFPAINYKNYNKHFNWIQSLLINQFYTKIDKYYTFLKNGYFTTKFTVLKDKTK